VPDVVGSARRTLEVFAYRAKWIPVKWPVALVAQDGMENMDIPWDLFQALFVGGGDPWKDSKASQDLVRTAKILGKHVHVGRVNTKARYDLFDRLGADTCDGTGIAKFDHMLDAIIRPVPENMSFLSGGFIDGQPPDISHSPNRSHHD